MKKVYQELDTWDALKGIQQIDTQLPSDVYDLLNVEETTTMQKLMDRFSKSLTLKKDAKPRVYVLKNTGLFDRKKFAIKQKECPICLAKGSSVLVSAPKKSFSASCPKCDATISFYTPLPLQKFIEDLNPSIVNTIGGYGSGKTTADMGEVARTAYELDGSHILVGAGSGKLLAQAQMELKYFFARPWVETKTKKGDFTQMSNGANGTWTLKNGSVIRFIPAADSGSAPEDMRSWNFNLAVLVEASNTNFFRGGDTSYFSELLARMRSDMGSVLYQNEMGEEISIINETGENKPYMYGTLNKILIESNPSPSELIPQVFNKSATLVMTEKVANKEKVIKRFMERFDPKYIDQGIVTVIASSRDNPNLSDDFLKLKFSGKSEPYIRRMRDADMTASEDQVYASALDYARKPLSNAEYRNADKVFHIFDPGTTDASGIMYAAYWKNWQKTGKPKIRIFKAVKTGGGDKRQEGNTIGEWVDLFDTIETQYGFTKRDYVNNKTTMSWFNNYGDKKKLIRIADHSMWRRETAKDHLVQKHTTDQDRLKKAGYNFKSAVKGPGSLKWGVTLVKTYLDEGIIEWDLPEEQLEEEFIRYIYKQDSNGDFQLDEKSQYTHLMDCLRYLIVEVDVELAKLGKSPSVTSDIADKMREAMGRREDSRALRFKNDMADMFVETVTRQQEIEKNNKIRKKRNARNGRNQDPNKPINLDIDFFNMV